MKGREIVITLFSAFMLLASLPGYGQKAHSIAVVELFTSEGCASCPAADELLKEMSLQKEKDGKPFIGLSFHVTYWNHQGWNDPFSNEAYTKRQENYVSGLKLKQIYTPQVLVNGVREFVGSNATAFRDTLAAEEKRKASFSIDARATLKGDSIEVSYVLSKDSKNHVLNIALVEKNIENKVMRGENKSRTLRHYNVVRQFKSVDLREQGRVAFKTVENLATDNTEVVLYVQQRKLLKIVGATKIPVSAIN